jgi:hypothetical protein
MPPVTGRREESPDATGVGTAAEVADLCGEEEIEAAGMARMRENGMVVEAVESASQYLGCRNKWPRELDAYLSALWERLIWKETSSCRQR